MKARVLSFCLIVVLLGCVSAFATTAPPPSKKIFALDALYKTLNAPHQALVGNILWQLVNDHIDRISGDPKEVEMLLNALEKNRDNFWDVITFQYLVYAAAKIPWFTEFDPQTGAQVKRLRPGWALPGYRSLARLEFLIAHAMRQQFSRGSNIEGLFAILEGQKFQFQTCASYLASRLNKSDYGMGKR